MAVIPGESLWNPKTKVSKRALLSLHLSRGSYYVFFNVLGGSIKDLNHKGEKQHLSNGNKTLLTFHYTGCLIRILIMVDYNPHITG